MSNQAIDLLGLELQHPVLVSSGPMGDTPNSINMMLEHGAAAVVTKTIAGVKSLSKKIVYTNNMVFNKDGYSRKNLEEWYKNLETLRGKNIIANIFADNPENLSEIGKNVSDHGAKVIELCLSCPTRDCEPICFNLELLKAFCKKVRHEVDIPIIVKLMLSTSGDFNRKMVETVNDLGIDGISVSDSLPAIFIDNNANAMSHSSGGLSGEFMKPLVLKFLYDIKDIRITKIAIGGVNTGKDIYDYLNYGAAAVGLCSTILLHGSSQIKKIRDEYSKLRREVL